MKRTKLRACFPYFGSKYDIADAIWARLGNPDNYIEPFAGSLAVLLNRPAPGKVETVNDTSGLVVNFWRAVTAAPEEVARWADQPVHETTLHAVHRRLVALAGDLAVKLADDDEYFDAKLAGKWAWGASAWLGGGWCDGALSLRRPALIGRDGSVQQGHGGHRDLSGQIPSLAGPGGLVMPRRLPAMNGGSGRARNGHGVHRTELSNLPQKRPALIGHGDHARAGHGVHRDLHQSRPHLSNGGVGVHATTLPHLSGGGEEGVGYGRGVHSRAGRQFDGLVAWLLALADRMRFVRVCCGDFMRVLTKAVTTSHGLTGVLLDPPYDRRRRAGRIYAGEDDDDTPHDETVGQRAAAWARENGENPLLRIALCGLKGEHDMPPDWFELAWETGGGYGNQAAAGRGRQNAKDERIWFSPACISEERGVQFLLPGLG